MYRARASIAVVLLALLSSCAPVAVSPSAEACATVVQQARGLPNRVEVTGTVETAEGQVEIRYESVDAENIPVTGSASCSFAVGGGGSLELVEGFVDGEMLDAAAVTSANQALSKAGR